MGGGKTEAAAERASGSERASPEFFTENALWKIAKQLIVLLRRFVF
jgi:hypothetical protein